MTEASVAHCEVKSFKMSPNCLGYAAHYYHTIRLVKLKGLKGTLIPSILAETQLPLGECEETHTPLFLVHWMQIETVALSEGQ